jgi:peptide/nickel transport system substrate-binding protein
VPIINARDHQTARIQANGGIGMARLNTTAEGCKVPLTRRVLLGAGAASLLATDWPFSSAEAASVPRRGGRLLVGCAGGGAKDTLDAHNPVSYPDIARCLALYEPLAMRNADYRFEMILAEEIAPNATADVWTVKLRKGVSFHNGKTMTADDAIFSLQRIINPKSPGAGAAGLSAIDPNAFKKLDTYTFSIGLKSPFATFDTQLGQYGNGIVPVGYDPHRPVGTGPFKYGSFTPGDRSNLSANRTYWRHGLPYTDELVIIDFPDDTARINALMGGQLHAIDNVPFTQARPLGMTPGLKTLVAKTGAWLPFTMRVDQAPFNDVRVRQAMRLIVDRPQMIAQALAGEGSVANDLYSPFDPCYDSALPQRHQDLDQAKSLLRAAGQQNLKVELVTADVAAGVVEAAQVLAEQAKGAGVGINVRKVDSGVFYGDQYLKWTFAQDFWFTRDYLPQVANCALPDSPYNETHWNNERFQKLIGEARQTLDAKKRCALVGEAQRIEYESGGFIIWSFRNQIDAYSAKVAGFVPAKTGTPLGNYGFAGVHFV